MNISIENFGPIKKVEFDLNKDFHLIVGENNVGKSYAISLIYLILKAFLGAKDFSRFLYSQSIKEHLNIHDLIIENESLTNIKHKKTIEITNIIKEKVQLLFEAYFITSLNNSLANSFHSIEELQNEFTEDRLKITIDTNVATIDIVTIEKELSVDRFSLKAKYYAKCLKSNRSPTSKLGIVYVTYPENNEDVFTDNCISIIIDTFLYLVEDPTTSIKSIHYLPASRSGLYQALSAFGQIIAELTKSKSFLRNKVELPGISEPLSDYFIKLAEIKVSKKSFADKPTNIIANRIEKEILNGSVEFDTSKKEIIFKPFKTNLKLELSSTSSMVSELSPIVAYLRYVLTEPVRKRTIFQGRKVEDESHAKPLIFIEEPEAHLHPEVQLKLMALFAELVKENTKIIITSHSNYMFNKTNNLFIEKSLNKESATSTLLRMHDHGSIGKALNIDEFGIDDENFVQASESLLNQRYSLIEKMNKQ